MCERDRQRRRWNVRKLHWVTGKHLKSTTGFLFSSKMLFEGFFDFFFKFFGGFFYIFFIK